MFGQELLHEGLEFLAEVGLLLGLHLRAPQPNEVEDTLAEFVALGLGEFFGKDLQVLGHGLDIEFLVKGKTEEPVQVRPHDCQIFYGCDLIGHFAQASFDLFRLDKVKELSFTNCLF